MNTPFGKRMSVVTARVLIKEDGPGDAAAAVNDILAAHREFIDVKVDGVNGPEPLDYNASLPGNEETHQ